jgi:hypothetical protein
MSFGEQYKRFALSQPHVKLPSEARLYVEEIREGSIITKLVDFAQLSLPLVADMNTLMQFAKHLKGLYDVFLGKSKDDKNLSLEKSDLIQLSKIVNPVAKDNGSQINISNVYHGDVSYTINLDSVSSNAIQNDIARRINSTIEPKSNIHQKVVIKWYQTKNDPTAQTGDKGIIESIYPRPVKVVFSNEESKVFLLQEKLNIFLHGFIVDVRVETLDNIPVLYNILNLYGTVEQNK